MTITKINQEEVITKLTRIEPSFAEILALHGPPPLWKRKEGFPTLIRIILEQQVSLASAKAAFDRLVISSGTVTPTRFLEFTDDELKAIGFSRQKTAYGRHLSRSIIGGSVELENLDHLTDDEIRQTLTQVKGIGIWTANIYLLMAMQRADIWPKGDIALAAAYKQIKNLDKRPTNDEMVIISNQWKPYRSVAARLLWHSYLSAGK
ncbi:DNA-3-methyladenine glycosylase family protein [Desulfosediminicola flagellatus]|uniref:DNA-3-methyladenine glycosylase family protein n=1 Tax=Desulfosediminicola flagellatus TaxID=2569541 RepID=UPI0010AC2BDD|nr:DNA-3-methyladenine glycosylase [Desulfosediminicola flagellatus]